MKTPKIKERYIVASWLIIIVAGALWPHIYLRARLYLDSVFLPLDPGLEIHFFYVVQIFCYLVGVVMSYLIYRFALSIFILPNIASRNV